MSVTDEMITQHELEFGVVLNGILYFDGCPDAEFDECAICREMDRREMETQS